jgi:hypothetical protein
MRKFIFLGIIGVLFLQLPGAQPRIRFENNTLQIGVIDEGDFVDLEFAFENVGDETLLIKRIDTSCGCIRSILDKREYAPGEKGILKLIYNSQGRLGRINEQVVVIANSEARFHRLQIEGTVTRKNYAHAALPVEMRRVEFGEVLPGTEHRQEIRMENIGTRALRVIEVTVSPQVMVRFSRTRLEPGESAALTIIFTPLELGEFSTFVKIRTSGLKGENITVHVIADVVDELGETEESSER